MAEIFTDPRRELEKRTQADPVLEYLQIGSELDGKPAIFDITVLRPYSRFIHDIATGGFCEVNDDITLSQLMTQESVNYFDGGLTSYEENELQIRVGIAMSTAASHSLLMAVMYEAGWNMDVIMNTVFHGFEIPITPLLKPKAAMRICYDGEAAQFIAFGNARVQPSNSHIQVWHKLNKLSVAAHEIVQPLARKYTSNQNIGQNFRFTL